MCQSQRKLQNTYKSLGHLNTWSAVGGCLWKVKMYDLAGSILLWGFKRLMPFWVITFCFLLVVQDVCFQLLLMPVPRCLHSVIVDSNPLKPEFQLKDCLETQKLWTFKIKMWALSCCFCLPPTTRHLLPSLPLWILTLWSCKPQINSCFLVMVFYHIS